MTKSRLIGINYHHHHRSLIAIVTRFFILLSSWSSSRQCIVSFITAQTWIPTKTEELTYCTTLTSILLHYPLLRQCYFFRWIFDDDTTLLEIIWVEAAQKTWHFLRKNVTFPRTIRLLDSQATTSNDVLHLLLHFSVTFFKWFINLLDQRLSAITDHFL